MVFEKGRVMIVEIRMCKFQCPHCLIVSGNVDNCDDTHYCCERMVNIYTHTLLYDTVTKEYSIKPD